MDKQQFVKQFFRFNKITRETTNDENEQIWKKLSESSLGERSLLIQYLKKAQHSTSNIIRDFEEIFNQIKPFE